MNQLWNCKNHNQGTEKRVLTICSAGLLRSPTAAAVLQETYGFNCRAAGIVEEYALIPVSDVLVHWADELVFMEQAHLEEFQKIFKDMDFAEGMINRGYFQVLDIPDSYPRNDPTLRELIITSYNEKK